MIVYLTVRSVPIEDPPQYTFDNNWIISPGGGESEVGIRFTFLLCWLFFFFCFPQYPPPDLTWMACTLLHWARPLHVCMYQWPYFLHVHFILSFGDNNVIHHSSEFVETLERLSYNITNNQTIIKKQLCSHIRAKVRYFPTSDRHYLVSKKPHLHLGTYTTYLMKKRRPVRLPSLRRRFGGGSPAWSSFITHILSRNRASADAMIIYIYI